MEPSQRQLSSLPVEERQNSNISNGVSSTSPPVKGNNTKTGPTITTSPESIPSVPITPQPAPSNNEGTTIYWDIQ